MKVNNLMLGIGIFMLIMTIAAWTSALLELTEKTTIEIIGIFLGSFFASALIGVSFQNDDENR